MPKVLTVTPCSFCVDERPPLPCFIDLEHEPRLREMVNYAVDHRTTLLVDDEPVFDTIVLSWTEPWGGLLLTPDELVYCLENSCRKPQAGK